MNIDGLEWSIGRVVDDGWNTGVRASVARLQHIARVQAKILVPDMVRPLQRFTVSVDEGVLAITRGRAMGEAVRDVAAAVRAERDERHWNYCDP